MTGLTRAIGEYIADMHHDSMADGATAMVRDGITDCAAVTILGRDAEVVRILRSVLATGAADAGARLCFGRDRADAPQAALINGAAAHALDFDDIGLNSLQPTHPSAVLASAVLAEGEALGCSGRELVAAYATGYEVWGELAWREAKPYHVKGWHPTATFGAIAAAAAAARLHRLDPVRASYALGIAASQAGGVIANFGSMTKPFHAGRAAGAGVLSARLAAAGMSAAPDVLEHPQGFLRAMSPAGEVDLDTPPRLGERSWLIEDGLGFKLYPMCYGTHRALDGANALAREHDVAPASIESIEVEATELQLANLGHHDPQTALDAKFSMEFAMAAAFIARRATLAEVNDAFVRRADVRALMRKVRLRFLPPAPARSGRPPADGVVVTLSSGGRLEQRFQWPLGHPKRPAGAAALWTKFADCTRGALSGPAARRLFDQLQNLEALDSLAGLPLADT